MGIDSSSSIDLKEILLVNCEPNIRESLKGYLDADPESYRLLTSRDDESTFKVLLSESIFLVVIFIDDCHKFPQSFLKEIIVYYPQLEIVLVLPPNSDWIRSTIPDHPHLQIIEKTFASTSIVRLIRELHSSKHNQGFTGTLNIVQLDDLVQMCCLSGATITIKVSKDLQQGVIFIRDGELVHAECGEMSGEEAFYTIMTWHNGGFETLDGNPNNTVTIKTNYQYLLLESARRSDEANKIFENEPTEVAEIVSTEPDKLRVLMVEDSTIMTKIMSNMLLETGDIEIAGVAHNGEEALQMMDVLQFDLILLDVNMPVMNGRITMKHIMIKSPCPVVIMSNVGSRSPETIISLLDLGAVDFISKPVRGVRGENPLLQQQKIIGRVRKSATAKTSVFRRFRNPKVIQAPTHHESNDKTPAADRLVIVSSGCSGHGALYHLVSGIPATNPLTLVSLNALPITFMATMSAHLGRLCDHSVTPITDGTPLQSGRFYLDSQKRPLRLLATDNPVLVRSQQEQHDSEYRPDYFDLFLFSAADYFKDRLLVILLSGAEIGDLVGLRYVREKGGCIFIQSPSSCMMPDSLTTIIQENLTDLKLKPEAIANKAITWANGL